MSTLRTKLLPSGQMQLSRKILGLAAGAVALLVVVLVMAQRSLPSLSSLMARKEPEPVRTVELPEVLKPAARPYADLQPRPAVPVAQPVPKTITPVVVTQAPPPPPTAAPAVSAQPSTPPDWLQAYLDQQNKLTEAAARQSQSQAIQPKQSDTKKETPTRTPWVITPTDITIKRPESKGIGDKEGKEQPGARGRIGQDGQLIHHAIQERPVEPWNTLYMSQKLTGRTMDAVNSDEPGITRIELTIPVLAKEYDYEILPKGSIAIVRQEGKPNFGQSTVPVKLVQIEPPNARGQVISFKGSVGDENGANGLRGKTNNHYGKLLLATGINALMSLGSNALAGTPSGFYGNPAQTAARETSHSVSNDIKTITEAQLKVPPTITKKIGEIVTIQLEENVTLSRKTLVVR